MSGIVMGKIFYRYRPICVDGKSKTVVDELNNGEIYLSKLEENNDPMDGYQQMCWAGDEIVWENFVKHYLLCMLISYSYVRVGGNQIVFNESCINAQVTASDISTIPLGEVYKDFLDRSFKSKSILDMVRVLGAVGEFGRQELEFVLSLFSPFILKALKGTVSKYYKEEIVLPQVPSLYNKQIKKILNAIDELKETKLSVVSDISCNLNQELQMISRYRIKNKPDNCIARENNFKFITMFPHYYLRSLEKSIFWDYYIASFSAINDSTTMWGHYANGHRGICLIFDFEEQGNELVLRLKNGKSLILKKVIYDSAPAKINFFQNLGYLNRFAMEKHWFSRNGVKSAAINHYNEGFHNKYWSTYYAKLSHKFSEWQYEEEYRLFKSTWFEGPMKQDERLMNYDYKHLKGVIFGANTSEDDEFKIMKVIDELHDKKLIGDDFKFYKAGFSLLGQRMQVNQLSLIQFSS